MSSFSGQRHRLFAILLLALAIAAGSASCAEKVTLNVAGRIMHCDVVRISKSEVTVVPEGQREQAVPLALLLPNEISDCYKQAIEPKNAALRFDMGVLFLKKELYDEAKVELAEAAKLDGDLSGRVESLLKYIATTQPAAKAPDSQSVAASDKSKPATPAKPGDMKPSGGESDADSVAAENDFQKRFGRRNVPPRSEAKMKEFLDKRLEDLNTIIGGPWRMIETKHYYCFSNIPEPKHRLISTQWNETLYDLLCKVLRHKDGDKLWNNKMPVYYFENFKQFQKFAVQIDKSPGGAYSGGYFAADGRDVHICVPFMAERAKGNTARMDEMARSTICHEGTHAFLQLSGEDVKLSRWLHEGMAQFIEFLSDNEKNPDRINTVDRLSRVLNYNRGTLPSWEETMNRPAGGTDSEGYSLAYAKLEFLYRNFDHQSLPQMIRLIKSGKPEAEAMETVFKVKVGVMEDYYRKWIKEAIKINFNFPTQ